MILVTGGTGLVGAHLLYKLVSNGMPVRAIHRKNSNLERVKHVFSYYADNNSKALFKKIDWQCADLSDIPALTKAYNGITEVYHCAALISFSNTDYKKMRKINIDGTANVVNLCISNNVKKLCFISSIATISVPLNNTPATEVKEWTEQDKKHGYAITKYGAEMEVWRAGQEGVPVVIVNPGVILGSGFWQSGSGSIFDKIYNKFPFYTEGITGFVDVDDVVNCMVLLMNSRIENERFILVSENKTYQSVFFNIADAFGKSRPKIKITPWMSSIAWRLFWFAGLFTKRNPVLTKHTARSSHTKRYFSNEKIKKTLDYTFKPIEVSVKENCKRYLRDRIGEK
ncbi:MAG: NAD-dependent epimerase [Flavobacteriales bacterium]|nr:MAG: NAD-dependent epimerase [Flavobacteriales bacterium]